jgi:hypothetical protein
MMAPPAPPAPRQPILAQAYGVAAMTNPIRQAGVGLPNYGYEQKGYLSHTK